jgi:hypothetical protein
MAAKQASNIGRRSVKHPVISVTRMMPVTGARTTAVNHATENTAKNESHRILFTRIGISQVYPSLFIQLGGVFGYRRLQEPERPKAP